MRMRWWLIAGSCGTAVVLAMAMSLLSPRQYTATARIVIEPPAGADARGSMAVSPIYLESLKTYEHFAASDSLFRKAVDRFGLRSTGPIESLKRRVLKVGLARNTRILEITCTLPDARKSHELAQFLAESAVELNRSLAVADDENLIGGIERQQREASQRLDELNAAWSRLLAAEPVEELEAAQHMAAEMRAAIEQQILSAQLELADSADREKQAAPAGREQLHKEQANTRARLDQMRQQFQALVSQGAEREKTLAARMGHRDKLTAELKGAGTAMAAADARLREARSEVGFRGERLEIVDPGIVPERPSSPNLPLNVAAALLLGLLLPLLYLAVEMNYREQQAGSRRAGLRAFSSARNE